METRTSVALFTSSYVVHGRIGLVPGARLTDFIRTAETFIVVTDAVVSSHEGREVFRAPFINVRRDSIELALLEEDVRAQHHAGARLTFAYILRQSHAS